MNKHLWTLLLLFFSSFLLAQDLYFYPFGKLSVDGGSDITAIHFSSDGERVVAGDDKGNVRIWTIEDRRGPSLKFKKNILFVRFIKNNEEILVVDGSGVISWHDAISGNRLNSMELDESPEYVTIDPSEIILCTMDKNGTISLMDLSSNMPIGKIQTNRKSRDVLYIGFDQFTHQLAAISSNGEVLNWNPLNQQIIRQLKLTAGEFYNSRTVVESAATNKSSDLFVSGVQEAFIPKGGGTPQREFMIMAYNWESGTEYKRVKINWQPDQIALGPGIQHVTIMNRIRKRIQLINLAKGEVGSQLSLEDTPTAVVVSDDNNWLAVGSGDGALSLYSIERNASPSIDIQTPPVSRSYAPEQVSSAAITIEGITKDLPGVSEVTINGERATIDGSGKFSAQVPLNLGKNKIRVVAEGRDNSTAVKDIFVTRILDESNPLTSTGSASHAGSKRIALVIGNSAYTGTAPLKNAANDAELMSTTLESLGFEVIKITDGGYEDIRRGIINFGEKILDVDVSMFYYAGHGLEVDGVNYLVPVDADIGSALDVKQKCISSQSVLRTMEYANDEGLNMIILDACRNNPFPTGKRGGAGLSREVAPSGTLIAFATDPGSVASDGDGENGLYTGELARQMLIPQRIEDVFMNTRNIVEEKSNNSQRPWEEARLKGVFYLKNN